jgi:hypothetical protein
VTAIRRSDDDPTRQFLAQLSWDEFFRRFEVKRHAFVYEDEGRFFQLVERTRA